MLQTNRSDEFAEASRAFRLAVFGAGTTAKLWHRQYYDHIIRNREDFDETLAYIRMNPLRRGLVTGLEDWPYTERLDYLHLVQAAMEARAGTSPAPTE